MSLHVGILLDNIYTKVMKMHGGSSNKKPRYCPSLVPNRTPTSLPIRGNVGVVDVEKSDRAPFTSTINSQAGTGKKLSSGYLYTLYFPVG